MIYVKTMLMIYDKRIMNEARNCTYPMQLASSGAKLREIGRQAEQAYEC